MTNTETSAQEARGLWLSLVREDRDVQQYLKLWTWRDKAENPEQFNRAYAEACKEGVNVIRFLQGAKLCVIEDNKWTLANLMRYSRLRRAKVIELNSSAVDGFMELTDDDLDGFDFGD